LNTEIVISCCKSCILYSLFRRLHWHTYLGDFINTLKAFIGTNYQSLPFAFANSGLGVSVKSTHFLVINFFSLFSVHCFYAEISWEKYTS